MSTLPLHAPRIPHIRLPLLRFAHLAAFAEAVVDVFAEADRMACAARARYPAAD